MTIRNLEALFAPRSVAVIGASDRPGSVGAAVTRNVLTSGFRGTVSLVNPGHAVVAGRRAYADVESLDEVPELAVICTPPAPIPALVSTLGARGTRAAVVLTAPPHARSGSSATPFRQALLDAARPHMLRVLGPNCVGLLVPSIGLNASFAHAPAQTGALAFVSQSGALTTALLDWARARNIGFSHFVSLGDSADVDFGDVLNYLASDATTTAILLYIESITAARKFMSAARATGRSKRIIVVKAGRAPEGAKAAASHTGALAGSDDVYDAALRRAGALRVDSTLDLFVAAETLARAKPFAGERLAIVTNGGGPGVMAADALCLNGGTLAALSPETMDALDRALPPTWSHGNPVDIIGDAPASRYVEALQAVLADPGVDAVLLLHAPTAIVDSASIAAACVPLLERWPRPAFTCWLGGAAVTQARAACLAAGLPTYATPEEAVSAFLQVTTHRHNQQLLMQTPPSLPTILRRDSATAQRIVAQALAQERTLLGEAESKSLLHAYGVDVVETRVARDAAEAVRIADELGYPVALKIHSPDISHKSDVGGVALALASSQALIEAAQGMEGRVRAARPEARLAGFTVERMVIGHRAHELIVGVLTDPVFGPVILFGKGGIAVETERDKAVALPPLNVMLARELVARTRVAKLLAGYRDVAPIDSAALERTLLGVAQLIAEIPEVVELDINPLLADSTGAIALDARVVIAPASSRGTERLAIRPYPVELEETIRVNGRDCLLRPVRPEDEPRYPPFLAQTSREDIYFRFFHVVRELPHSELARFTQIDYDREMAFLALDGDAIVGVVRTVSDPDNIRAEFAILVRSDWIGHGLGHALMMKIIAYNRSRGTQEIDGDVLSENTRMLEMAVSLGFEVGPSEDGTTRVKLVL